jgi:hypothetical protein
MKTLKQRLEEYGRARNDNQNAQRAQRWYERKLLRILMPIAQSLARVRGDTLPVGPYRYRLANVSVTFGINADGVRYNLRGEIAKDGGMTTDEFIEHVVMHMPGRVTEGIIRRLQKHKRTAAQIAEATALLQVGAGRRSARAR